MNEIISNKVFIKDLVDNAIEHKKYLTSLLVDIKSVITNKEIEQFLQKYWQKPDFRLYNTYWNIEIDDLKGLGEECYIYVDQHNGYSNDVESISIKYFLDEKELQKHIDKVNKQREDLKLAEAKLVENRERALLAKLKEKYNEIT